MDTIDGMRTFAAVAAEGSFTAAARRLNMTTKLTSKYVRQLEERLGAQLFNRTTRSVVLTDLGRAYVDRCRLLLDQFDELQSIVQERQSDLAGTIRMTASTSFGSTNLIAALGPFKAAHPNVSIDLHLTDQRVSVIEDGFDLAIRFGELEDSSLIARRLRDMRYVICAAPDYLARHGSPAHPDALATHDCLVPTWAVDPQNWRFRVDGEIHVVRVSGQFRSNSPRAIAEMAAAGLGLGRSPLYVVEPFLSEGRLELLLEDFEPRPYGLYAVYPPNRHLTARVRALIDHLAETLKEST